MPLDLRGFEIPESSYAGLYKAASTAERSTDRQLALKQSADAKRLATAKFIESTYDPKDLFTGTLEDPNITKGLMDIKQQAYNLANQGVDPLLMQTALSPQVKRLSDYSDKAKVLAAQKTQAINFLKTQKGVDTDKFSNEFDSMAFKDENGQVRDPSTIDPNTNYADQVLRTRPVFNNEGIQDFVQNSGKDTRVNKVKRINSKGGYYNTDAEMTAPNYMQPEMDHNGAVTGFEPKFNYATSENEKLIHEFQGDNGPVSAPVKMVTDDVFNSLTPNAKAYILQESRQMAQQHGKDPSQPEVENFAKAIAYDELKNAAKNSSTIKDIVTEKANPAPRISVHVNTNGSANVNEAYKRISTQVEDDLNKGYTATRINALDQDDQDVVLNFAKKLTGNEKLSNEDIFISKVGGQYNVYKTGDNGEVNANTKSLVGPLTKTGVDLKANQPLGVKTKQQVLKEGNQQPPIQVQKTYKYNGKDISLDKVQKAAQQSGLTVDEYVKRFGLQ